MEQVKTAPHQEPTLCQAACTWERLTNENANVSAAIEKAKKDLLKRLRDIPWPENCKSIAIEGTNVRGIRSTKKCWKFDASKITLDWITRLAHTPCAGALGFTIDGDYYSNHVEGYELMEEIGLHLEVTYAFSVKLSTTQRKSA